MTTSESISVFFKSVIQYDLSGEVSPHKDNAFLFKSVIFLQRAPPS